MADLKSVVAEKLPLTMGETIALAKEYGVRVVDVVLTESELRTGLDREGVLKAVMEEYAHNLKAVEIGVSGGNSFLLGTVPTQLKEMGPGTIFADVLLDKALMYTVAAEVGNHCIGVRPCAGTGDPCPYTGFLRALMDVGTDETTLAEVACLMLKVGSLFRVAKVTTGCNLEGYGAGSAAIAAATVHLKNGTPEQMEKAMVLAMSPTIGVPCTPRVLVPALCTAHVGGAILGGMYAGRLCTTVEMTVNVPFDVMFAMASLVHKESAHHIVPTVVEYMEPFFQRTAEVESLVSEEVHKADKKRIEETLEKAKEIAKKMADGSAPIIKTLGDAVVGEITIELYPELFARRTINVPGVLMGAVYGCSTSDYKTYEVAVERVKADGVKVNIVRGEEYQIQKVTLVTDKGNSVMVDTLNRGGGRLVLRNATPSLEKAQEAAKKLGIVVVE